MIVLSYVEHGIDFHFAYGFFRCLRHRHLLLPLLPLRSIFLIRMLHHRPCVVMLILCFVRRWHFCVIVNLGSCMAFVRVCSIVHVHDSSDFQRRCERRTKTH